MLDQCASALFEASPFLETFNLHMCGGLGPPELLLPRLPNLRHINLTFSQLNEHSLQTLLASCNNLCGFSYESAHSSNFFRDGYFDPHNDGGHFYL
ncbi:hypothetical protein BDV19DRAFT_367770 [Aspergillus venezuelensis]